MHGCSEIGARAGTEIWSINDFTTTNGPAAAIADGVLVEPNAYDNQVYAYGVGPSRTTVNAPSVGVTTATPITISGTVFDISAGSQQNAVAANFPNGLPCVSDESMTQFMEAVYQQQSMPANITGVPVTSSVFDSNGNYRPIGTATSNAMGVYGLTWTPDISGNFVVTATFAGSQAYYGSSASAYFYASEAVQAATPEPTQQPQSMADLYFLPVSIILIIAIVAVLVLMLLMFRKR